MRHTSLMMGWAIALAMTASAVSAQPAELQRSAELALMQGRVDEAIGQLHDVIATHHEDGWTHVLLCRAYYAEDQADAAVQECETALHTLGANSEAQDWMGRAYGKKADASGPIGGLRLAKYVKTAFETAVQLDPRNGAAVNDLSEYYVNAPSALGGGLDKADELAARVQVTLPQNAHRIRAMAAEHRSDYGTAEREFRQAVEVAGKPDAWVDLGAFFGRRKDAAQCVEALRHAVAADKARDAALMDVAAILMEHKYEPQMAEQALRLYLNSGNKSDAGPVVKAHLMLGKLLAKAGDKPGAKIEFGRALQLASNYAPAKHALENS